MGRKTELTWEELMEDMANLVYNEEGELGSVFALSKPIPSDPTGDECTCPSIKNYPRDTRKPRERSRQAPPKDTGTPDSFPFSPDFFKGVM